MKHLKRSLFAPAGGLAALLLALAGCRLMPSIPDFPLHPFAIDDQNTPTVEWSAATRKPRVLSQDMGPLVEFLRGHPDPAWSGTARADFILDAYGVPRLVYPIAASDPAFGRALAVAVSRWRYLPGLRGNQAVRVHLQVTLHCRGGQPPSPRYDELASPSPAGG